MASFYTVVQFVPDIIADERINIGVVAFDENRIKCEFLQDWERVRCFSNRDITFLKDFGRELSLHLVEPSSLTVDDLNEMHNKWRGSIQLTTPSAALMNLDELLQDSVRRYLVQRPPPSLWITLYPRTGVEGEIK